MTFRSPVTSGSAADSQVLAAAHRLAEIPGISLMLAIVIVAEIGLNMVPEAPMAACPAAAQA